MGLDDVKNQIVLLHQAVMMLDLQYRLEAIDFLSDCCNDLRFKLLGSQDIDGDQVLNLTMSRKEYGQFPNDINYAPFGAVSEVTFNNSETYRNNTKHYDYSDMPIDSHDDIPNFDDISMLPENGSGNVRNDDDPVNLVIPAKQELSSRGSRRKQMFTRKSLRRGKDELQANSTNGLAVTIAVENMIIKHLNNKSTDFNVSGHSGPLSCRSCRDDFTSYALYLNHIDQKKCRSKYDCFKCGDSFKYETHYAKHLAGHKENDCKFCSKKISSNTVLRKHLKEAHPEIKIDNNLIPCKFCPRSFSRLNRLYTHYQLQHSKGKFVCTSCGLFLPTKEKHREHMSDHDNEKKWTCKMCNKSFFSKNNLTKHMKRHELCKYKCITCKISVASKLELLSHKRKKHDVEGLEANFQCDVCHKQFIKKSALERHMGSHYITKSYTCNICVRVYGTLNALTKHQKRKFHFKKATVKIPESKYEKIYEDLYVCENCGKQYKTLQQLKKHMKIHQTTFQCDICHTTFSIKENLARHIKNHAGSKLATCELCGDSFSRADGLRDHRITKHSDTRLVACTLCPKSFKRNSELNRHMKSHTLSRPYVCFCGRTYKQAAHLRGHQKSAHGKLPMEEPKLLENDRTTKNYVSSDLSLGNFDGQDYNLQESFRQVPYVPEDYGEPMEYCDLQFESPASVSPAVDLSMVSISDVVTRVMGGSLTKPESKAEPEPASIPLVNLSDRVVQEYLLNLP